MLLVITLHDDTNRSLLEEVQTNEPRGKKSITTHLTRLWKLGWSGVITIEKVGRLTFYFAERGFLRVISSSGLFEALARDWGNPAKQPLKAAAVFF